MTRERNHTRKWFYLTKPNENAWSVHIFIWFDAMCGCICVKNNLIEKKERKKDSKYRLIPFCWHFYIIYAPLYKCLATNFPFFSHFVSFYFSFIEECANKKKEETYVKEKINEIKSNTKSSNWVWYMYR